MDNNIPNIEKLPVSPAKPESEVSFNTETKVEADIVKTNKVATPPKSTIQSQVAEPPKLEQEDELMQRVEEILANDVGEFYMDLDPTTQAKFKQQGEDAVVKINTILKQAKVRAKEIIVIITEWLQIVPGLNKFFIEQSAKIKTDKIMYVGSKNKNNK
jgi:hypothetical protein